MYRTNARSGAPDTLVVCRSCGVRKKVAFRGTVEGTFRCAGCAADQPMLRGAGDLEPEKMELVDQQPSEAYEQLSALIQTFGAAGKASQVSISCDGIHVVVGLSINSGTVMGLDLAAPAPGLLDVTFVRESDSHRDAKHKGVVREVQTGDAAFDEAVYIESAFRDEDVRAVLASPAVRVALMKLLEAVERVKIYGGHIKVSVSKTEDAFNPERIREWVSWLRVVAGAPRPLDAQDAPVPTVTLVAKVATYFFAPVGLTLGISGAARYGPIATRPYLIGVVVGLVVAALIHPLFRRVLRGRSTSHKDILMVRFASLVFVPFMSTGALFIYNGAMDRSAEQLVVMDVVSASVDDDDSTKIHVKTRDDAGNERSYAFTASKPTARAQVRVMCRAGALGWAWESGPASLTVASTEH